MVEEERPLKQGLKLFRIIVSTNSDNVEEERPLKQGLKLLTIITILVVWCR